MSFLLQYRERYVSSMRHVRKHVTRCLGRHEVPAEARSHDLMVCAMRVMQFYGCSFAFYRYRTGIARHFHIAMLLTIWST
jgi:hypothetical protein